MADKEKRSGSPIVGAITAGLTAVSSIFESEGFWEVRGKKFDLRDKKYEDQRPVIEKKAELEIIELTQEAETAEAWGKIKTKILERLVNNPDIILPERKIKKVLRAAKRRFKKRMK